MKNRMRRVLLSGAALLALLGTAQAADMATKMPVKAPPVPAPAYDWSGFYLGGYYGESWSQSNVSTPVPVGNAAPGSVDLNTTSSTGGVTAGYNLQLSPMWLVGVEGDFGYLGGGQLFQDFDDTIAVGEKNRWYATLRGRIGYVTGLSLIYVTGGVGFVHVTDTFGGDGYLAPASKPNCRAIGRQRPSISISTAAAITRSCPIHSGRRPMCRRIFRTVSRSSRPA
jgi:outer membrane immunogenic protein